MARKARIRISIKVLPAEGLYNHQLIQSFCSKKQKNKNVEKQAHENEVSHPTVAPPLNTLEILNGKQEEKCFIFSNSQHLSTRFSVNRAAEDPAQINTAAKKSLAQSVCEGSDLVVARANFSAAQRWDPI